MRMTLRRFSSVKKWAWAGLQLWITKGDDWIVDLHGYEKRFIVRADDILSAMSLIA